MDKVEGGEAQHHGLAEASEEHAHEADGGEVGYGALAAEVLVNGDAEEVPGVVADLAVAGLLARHALVHDVVLPYLHGIFVDFHAVFVVLLILVEREVLVDVLHVGLGFVGRAVGLGRTVGIDGVAVGVVDVLVAVEDGALCLVVVGAAEVVVLVGRGGHEEGIVDFGAHLGLHGVEEFGVGGIGAFLL